VVESRSFNVPVSAGGLFPFVLRTMAPLLDMLNHGGGRLDEMEGQVMCNNVS
jgi:hypothetical protein